MPVPTCSLPEIEAKIERVFKLQIEREKVEGDIRGETRPA